MMKKSMKKVSLLLCSVLIAAMTLVAGCGKETPKTSSVSTEVSVSTSTEVSTETSTTTDADVDSNVTTIGEGATEFTFVVVDKDGNETTFLVKTDEKTVGAALLKVNLIEGDNSEYGLYVKKVNGIVADWDVDQTYWAFFVNDEYALTGVDSTELVAGSTYAFKVSK